MGAAVSIVVALAGAVGSIINIVNAIRSSAASGGIAPNPVMKELEDRAKREKERAEEAERARKHAEDAKRKAEESARKNEEERRKAEDAKCKAEENARWNEEEKRNAEDAKRNAEEQRKKAQEEQKKTEEERKKAEEDKKAAEQAKRRAEEATKKAEEDKAAAEEQARLLNEQIREIQKGIAEGIKPIISPTLEEILETKARIEYKDGIFHFAVAGVSGSGKSSLINALRGVKNRKRGAAPAGVTETTKTITRYPDPDRRNPFAWYDVPGAGTLEIPDFIYFKAQGLYAFDCIIVVLNDRFTDTDIAILRNCARFNIPSYIVRSKSLNHIDNLVDDMPSDDDEDDDEDDDSEDEATEDKAAKWAMARAQYERVSRKSVADNLKKAGLAEQRLYLVDKRTMIRVRKGRRLAEAKVIDEVDLLKDLLTGAYSRRTASSSARG
ncbi:P-loop containing nucleoside triphosphate hydrolase protein [Laetiporus sulphureus 93-53]|uniref:p-loop containing nucleoside triphosphate hydrolase protein n=1 Tax=Laetiporus sulphureus 93-53 TaxID=1314785 RepID=A0A165B1J8_9APHY|nr:P-loop containing nucleoside triphosphate hydrolase protein [Laetiporus sulphureus 93-53]KZT00057.1 P-loop containing nucleoside triphosphate hydrolase protein [Laetiporus sulphureus 93-53]